MKEIYFKNAYFIKLGSQGCWEESSLTESKIRIGYHLHPLSSINSQQWDLIEKVLLKHHKKKGPATKDLNELKALYYSDSDDIWVTFYASKLWWCRVGEKKIYEDKKSRYRKTRLPWSNRDIDGNLLLINKIPGQISKIQGYRGTICKVHEMDILKRLLNNKPSQEFLQISHAKEKLTKEIENGLRLLHWKDFEILIDLIFRNAGWRRLSMIGESMKFVDIELEEPVTKDLYQVQVKSRATLKDFREYYSKFSDEGFRKLFFAVHSPENNLRKYIITTEQNTELLLPERIADMIIDSGLTNWLLSKIK